MRLGFGFKVYAYDYPTSFAMLPARTCRCSVLALKRDERHSGVGFI